MWSEDLTCEEMALVALLAAVATLNRAERIEKVYLRWLFDGGRGESPDGLTVEKIDSFRRAAIDLEAVAARIRASAVRMRAVTTKGGG
jgi:hypothetical protein